MANETITFNHQSIKGLKAQANTETYWRDGGGGFGIRVSPKGKKTFVYRYKFKGKSRLLTIGVFGKLTLAEANEKYSKHAAMIEKGGDPWSAEREAERIRVNSPTVAEFGEVFIEKYSKANKKSWAEDQRILNVYVVPVIGGLKLRDVTRLDVRNIINSVFDNGAPDSVTGKGSPIMANRILACVKTMFAYGVGQDVLEVNVCASIPKPAKETSRDRVLKADEIKSIWEALPSSEIGNAIKMLLITGQRTAEVRLMEWAELDGKVWDIPKSKTKNGLPQKLELPPLAMEIIELQRHKTFGSKYVFAGMPPKEAIEVPGDRCISEKAIARAFNRLITKMAWEHTTVHDLRRTLRTELSALGIDVVTAEKVLNHKLPGIMGVYDRHDYYEEKANSLAKWANKLESLVYPERAAAKESNIIPFPGKKAAM